MNLQDKFPKPGIAIGRRRSLRVLAYNNLFWMVGLAAVIGYIAAHFGGLNTYGKFAAAVAGGFGAILVLPDAVCAPINKAKFDGSWYLIDREMYDQWTKLLRDHTIQPGYTTNAWLLDGLAELNFALADRVLIEREELAIDYALLVILSNRMELCYAKLDEERGVAFSRIDA